MDRYRWMEGEKMQAWFRGPLARIIGIFGLAVAVTALAMLAAPNDYSWKAHLELAVSLGLALALLSFRDGLVTGKSSNTYKAFLFCSPLLLLWVDNQLWAKTDIVGKIIDVFTADHQELAKGGWVIFGSLILLSFAKDLEVDEIFSSVTAKQGAPAGAKGGGGNSWLPLVAGVLSASAAMYVIHISVNNEVPKELATIQADFHDVDTKIGGYNQQQIDVLDRLNSILIDVDKESGKGHGKIHDAILALAGTIKDHIAAEQETSKQVWVLETKVQALQAVVTRTAKTTEHGMKTLGQH